MIGIIVITHGRLGRELITAAEFILGGLERVVSLSVESPTESDRLHDQIRQAIAKVGGSQGVLILTDMFGGTPNNVALTLHEPDQVEVVTGVNLPMLIKAAEARDKCSLAELAAQVCTAGRDAIAVAGELLSS